MFFLKAKPKEKAELIFDVGSGSVALALLSRKSPQTKPIVHWYKNKPLNSFKKEKHKTEKAILIGNVATLCNDLSVFLRKNREFEITDANVILSAPWYISQAKRIKIDNQSSKIFSADDINGELQKIAQSLEEEAKKKSSELSNIFSGEMKVIEKNILNVEVNGYRVDSIIGKNAKTIAIDLFISIAPQDLCLGIIDKIKNNFSYTKININSFPMVHSTVLSDMANAKNSILIDMSGTTTDITKILDGLIVESVHLSIGKRDLINAITKNLTVPDYIAESMLRMYAEGVLSVRETADIDFVLKDTEILWKKLVSETILKMEDNGYICSSFVLSSDKDVLEHLKHSLGNVLKRENNELHCVSAISTIESYSELVDFSPVKEKDSFIALESIFAMNH